MSDIDAVNADGEGDVPEHDPAPTVEPDAQAVEAGHGTHMATPANPAGEVVTPDGEPVPPTQVRRPWRTTVRTVFQLVLALATLLPFLVTGVYGNDDDIPAVVIQLLAVGAAITRVMALPQVEQFLKQFLPFLAAQPEETHP